MWRRAAAAAARSARSPWLRAAAAGCGGAASAAACVGGGGWATPGAAAAAAPQQSTATGGALGVDLFGSGLGFGKKSAVIVIDFCKAYTQPGSKWYCPGKGFGVVDAVDQSVELLKLARGKGVPIFYTQVIYEHATDGGVFTQKIPAIRTWTKDNPLVQVDDKITPQKSDSVLVKQYPSAFFGTSLASNLRSINVDTCIMIGCSTSGCIRASVLDGMQNGFRCVIPRECVGDRTESVHEANLFDMNAKNGDVVPKSIVMNYLAGL